MSEGRTISVNLGGLGSVAFWMFAALLLLTGNCHCNGCGPQRDYVRDAMEATSR